MPQQPASEPTPVPAQAESERARRIREEIRRKIAERQRQQSEAPAPVPVRAPPARQPATFQKYQPPEEEVAPMHHAPPVIVARQPYKLTVVTKHSEEDAPQHVMLQQHEPEQAAVATNYETMLAKKISKLRAALQESEMTMQALRGRQAMAMPQRNWGDAKFSRHEILEGFTSVAGVRKAVIYSEIFGTPNSLRKFGSFTPLA